MRQVDLILRHLRDFGSISSWEALQEYGIMRTASRICDIRRMGIGIKSEIVTGKNRYGEPIKFARYSLMEEENKND